MFQEVVEFGWKGIFIWLYITIRNKDLTALRERLSFCKNGLKGAFQLNWCSKKRCRYHKPCEEEILSKKKNYFDSSRMRSNFGNLDWIFWNVHRGTDLLRCNVPRVPLLPALSLMLNLHVTARFNCLVMVWNAHKNLNA